MNDDTTPDSKTTPDQTPPAARPPATAAVKVKAVKIKAAKARTKAPKKQVERPYPRATLERALVVANTLKKNGGEAWAPADVANAMDRALGSPTFFYEASAAQKFGIVAGGRDAKEISL